MKRLNPRSESGPLSLADHDVLSVLVEGLSGHDLVAARGNVLEEVHPADLGRGGNGCSEVRILPVDRSLQAVEPNHRGSGEVHVAQTNRCRLH